MTRRDMLIVSVLVMVALLIFTVLFSRKYEGFRSNDQPDYSHIARNLYRGEGFTTKALKPLELAVNPRVGNHPDIWRAPLYPIMIYITFLLIGVKEYAGVLVTGLCYVLLGPAVYILGKRMAGREIGIAAALLVIFLPEMWDYSMHALTEVPFALLLVFLAYALFVGAHPLLTGAVYGICYLHRYNSIVFLPAVILFLMIADKRRWRGIMLFLSGAVLVTSPWLIRNVIVMGNPFYFLQTNELSMFTTSYPGYYLYAIFDRVDTATMLTQQLSVLTTKYMHALAVFTSDLPRLTHQVIMYAFFGTVLAFRLPLRVRLLLYTTMLMMLIQLHALAVLHTLTRLFLPFLPLITLFAVIGFHQLLQLLPWRPVQRGFMAAAVAVIALISIPKGWHVNYAPINAVDQEEAEFVREIPTDSAVITDQIWEMAWKADVLTIWTPAKYEEFEKYLPDAKYAFFSGTPFSSQWGKIYRQEYLSNPKFLKKFELVRSFSNGGKLYVRKPGQVARTQLTPERD